MALIILALLVLVAIVFAYVRTQKIRVRNKEKLIIAEQKALRAQMDPHFIFNAMNSIQFYISENNKDAAGLFLSKFSSLMRKILENSSHSFISLEEELEFLSTYLEVEKMRFANKFQYEIEVDNDISRSDTLVPSMMIQPFIENAIWHGLMAKKVEGNLLLRFEKRDEMLVCIIEDNGVGMKRSSEIRENRMHKSAALNNINERIKLLNDLYKMEMTLRMENLFEDHGTRAILSFKIPEYESNSSNFS